MEACRAAVKVHNATMLVAVIPNDNKQRYDAIKKTCFLECPGIHSLPSLPFSQPLPSLSVPCQVVQLSTIKRENILRSICQKIINQINCKMGGALWRVKIPVSAPPSTSTLPHSLPCR